MVNAEQLTIAPAAMERELRIMSDAEVPQRPEAQTVALSDLTRTKYPAVPELPAVPFVIVLAVEVTVPAEATAGLMNAVDPNARLARRVPVTEPSSAGCVP